MAGRGWQVEDGGSRRPRVTKDPSKLHWYCLAGSGSLVEQHWPALLLAISSLSFNLILKLTNSPSLTHFPLPEIQKIFFTCNYKFVVTIIYEIGKSTNL